ncbi:glycosyltransferase [Flavobacterium sp. SUN046]|uniref:glycosyltransferase n=1 Tax=Flavobacterium sp. SUN046 TaxID=3002440 RepID=UPI002DC00FEF|nr:glycosyltransferase [Flavobacterium sp. SUN046]MEC4049918.1 glycosyltransferase [Flavobacterium sp. SUN046]
MRANLFPLFNNSLIIYKEAIKNISNINLGNLVGNQKKLLLFKQKELPELVFISSYPPRECGIATYTQDLKNAIQEKFGHSFSLKVCALESKKSDFNYPDEVKYVLQTQDADQYSQLTDTMNADKNIKMIFLQHEFGLFGGEYGKYLLKFMSHLKSPISTTFHSVIPNPNKELKKVVRKIVDLSDRVIVMTNTSAYILKRDYGIAERKIVVIAHGTHLVSSLNDTHKRSRVHLADRIVLSTFGLLNEGKSIETALDALPEIIAHFPNVIYLIIGKTHPEVVKNDGEKYRDFLYEKVLTLNLQNNVRFINRYLSLDELMEHLQRTDLYLFTSKDPNQAVSGTLAYAMACGCPILSTPIPHAKELLYGAGLNFDFQNSKQLAEAAIKLLYNPEMLDGMRLNALHKINPTAWQNSAIAHIELIQNNSSKKTVPLKYEIPKISLDHIKKMTTSKGMLQFAAIATPDLESGYTLDDNARALIALTKHYELTGAIEDLDLISIYLDFIVFCQQYNSAFLNYVDIEGNFMQKNSAENLEDANGRAIWALGELISREDIINEKIIQKAKATLEKTLKNITKFKSPRAIAFSIKGLYFYNLNSDSYRIRRLIAKLADDLVSKYCSLSEQDWKWYEDYLTYANSVLPEAMLYASLSTGNELYKSIAKTSLDFLLSIIFKNNQIKVVSNQGWHLKGKSVNHFGEQPIDVAYTILALDLFYRTFNDKDYIDKMNVAFEWFLGRNHLHQIVYNPKTGGCYDGLEENHINLNQGAESTISYLMARLVFEQIENSKVETQLYDEVLQK